MKTYIILFGRSTWASLNTYYSVLIEEKYYPDLIWIVTETPYKEKLPQLEEGLEIISTGFDLKPKIKSTILEEGNIVAAGARANGVAANKFVDRISLYLISRKETMEI